MKRYILSCTLIAMLVTACAWGQDAGYTERAKKYIDEYSTLAILEQRKSGVPASITLGQGILETEAGASELMVEANNHFGIKCKNGWQGPTFSHTDDAPDECFKKYACAAESYKDHSDHLHRNPRYAPLFTISPTDYEGWAKCLKKCGYATNPQYAQRLIKIIEDFKLQDYTYSALDSSLTQSQLSLAANKLSTFSYSDSTRKAIPVQEPMTVATGTIRQTADSARNVFLNPPHVVTPAKTVATPVAMVAPATPAVAPPAPKPDPKPTQPAVATINTPVTVAQPAVVEKKNAVDESHIVMVNGLQAFYAFKDELLLPYAMKYHIGYHQLLTMNELSDGPLPGNMYVYMERKKAKGTNSQHILREGESLYMAAQCEGMLVTSLRELNLLNPNEEPVEGTILELQKSAAKKPEVRVGQMSAHTRNAIVLTEEAPSVKNNDFITIPKSQVSTFADTAKPMQITAMVKTTNDSVVKVALVPTPAARPAVAAPATPPVTSMTPIIATSVAKADTLMEDEEEEETPIANADSIVKPIIIAPVVVEPNAVAAKKTAKTYVVKKGDTAFSIAKNNNITLDQLAEWNDLDNNQVKVGQTLKINQ